MEKNDPRTKDRQNKSVEQFLRERARIDSILQEEFKKETTILFTDICGYTEYMETRGDIGGRAMLQKHNDIVFPAIEKHDGVIIKTIGDAVMATFSAPLAAVKAASHIQEGLYRHNLKAGPGDGIRVKIGINTGEALMDDGDVFGDAVNVAARIQSKAGEDQILLSKRVYEEVCGSDEVLCRLHGKVRVKGKSEPLQLYRVVWRDEDVVPETEPKVRTGEGSAPRTLKRPQEVLYLEVAREGNRIKLSAHEQKAGEESTLRHYEETQVSMDLINTRCHEMVEALNKVNRRGLVSHEVLKKLREIGQVFSDELFTLDVKERLKRSGAEHLILNLDDQLVHMPWELLHDGQQFLCQRFNVGRLVRTRQAVGERKTRVLARPLKMLVLADPGGDLKGAYNEGTEIRDTMDLNKDLLSTTLRSGSITPDFIKEKIRNFDLIHFAGHSDYDPQRPGESGWRLTGGSLKANDITKMAGTGSMPSLIFSNACQSARTEEWGLSESFQEQIFGLANVFLLSGVKHYVGTFWEIMDEPSSRFATEFYKCFISGMTMGEAVREARHTLIGEFGEENIVWASYILYGDPTSNYMDQIMEAEPHEGQEPPPAVSLKAPGQGGTRSGEETIDFSQGEIRKRGRGWMAIAAGIVLFAAVLLWGYPGLLTKGTAEYERAALAYYNDGAFDKALNTCKTIEEKNPQVSLAYLIRGDVYFRRGKLDQAEQSYKKALQAKNGTGLENSKAFIGLGRIASIRNRGDEALKYYENASRAAPDRGEGYLSQALLLEEGGDYGQALGLFKKARKLSPGNRALAAITDDTAKKVAFAEDKEKQARIDLLVKDLLESMKSPPRALPSDGWTSFPLTMWIMDLKQKGYSLQEGEERLLISGITDQLLEQSRVRLVERSLLDKLLQELKLGTSKLADRNTALSLGRILAAKLIVSGRIIYSGTKTQVSIRLIETETGRITASVSETFGSGVPVSTVSEKLSKRLEEKLNKLYPLRGKISGVEGNEVRLNIGQMAGTRMGQRLKVVGEDTILEVISDQPRASLAKIVKGKAPLAKGMRVEAGG